MYEYQYARELVNGEYNINNPLRVDSIGHVTILKDEIPLTGELKSNSIITLEGDLCTIGFDEELTAQQKTVLDIIVENHKNNA